MKIRYAIALGAIPVIAFASGNGNPPPSGRVTTIEDVKNVLFYLAIAMVIVASILSYLQHSLRQAIKRRTKSAIALAQANENGANTSDAVLSPPIDIHLFKVRAELQAAREALQEELYKVQGRSSLNLAIGILISLAAIGILASQLGDAPPKNASWESLFAIYFPRFVACVFIELLAFFFLRLYRAGIAEMRTYGIDLKELTLKQVAIETVWAQENAESPRSKFALELLQQEPKKGAAAKAVPEIDPQKALEVLQKLTSAFVEKNKDKSDKKDDE